MVAYPTSVISFHISVDTNGEIGHHAIARVGQPEGCASFQITLRAQKPAVPCVRWPGWGWRIKDTASVNILVFIVDLPVNICIRVIVVRCGQLVIQQPRITICFVVVSITISTTATDQPLMLVTFVAQPNDALSIVVVWIIGNKAGMPHAAVPCYRHFSSAPRIVVIIESQKFQNGTLKGWFLLWLFSPTCRGGCLVGLRRTRRYDISVGRRPQIPLDATRCLR